MKKERFAEWKYFSMALEKRDGCVCSCCAFQIPLEKCSQENGLNKVGDGGMEYQSSLILSFVDFSGVFTAPGHPQGGVCSKGVWQVLFVLPCASQRGCTSD